jgi:uncharacterized protein involved in cysteine biosynthesis
MQGQTPSMFKPALISGIAFGVAGAIPLINLINCACCALVIGCGFLAAYLQSQQCKSAGATFTPGAGAQVGLISGLIYGVVNSIITTLIQLAFGIGDWQEALEQMEELGMMDPEAMEQAMAFMDSTGPVVIVLFALFVTLLLGAVFATIGGLIGGSVFKVEGPQAPAGGAPIPPAGGDAPQPPPVQP